MSRDQQTQKTEQYYIKQDKISREKSLKCLHSHLYIHTSLPRTPEKLKITPDFSLFKNKLIAVDGIFGVPGERSRGGRLRQE